MASKRGGNFEEAFRAVFRRSPSDLYDRFRAEITARAVEQERRLESEGIVAGERWQRLEGGTASPAVSPDGTRLLARRSAKRGRSELVVWTIEPSETERASREKRERRERDLAPDPNEVPDLFEPPERREPAWKLPAANGRAAEDPRWLPDGRVLFTRREPDRDGVLHRDLFVWDLASGAVARRTVSADVGDADPAPDGSVALAVRNRY
jgi:Tol biopolymer transport system component